MELGYISEDSLPVFQSLLLPVAAEAIKNGEPLTALGVSEDGCACGALAGFLRDNDFQIVSLYVAPDWRRKGGGDMLFDALEGLLREIPDGGGIEIGYIKSSVETMAKLALALQLDLNVMYGIKRPQRTLDCDDLSETQIAVLQSVIQEFRKQNNK